MCCEHRGGLAMKAIVALLVPWISLLILGCGASQPTTRSLATVLQKMRDARCATAYCFGRDGDEFAVEPLADIPIGKTFVVADRGSLGTFINNHSASATLTAGIRVWALYDLASLSMYLSKPVFTTEDHIRVHGSAYEQPITRVKQPYPGIALGLLADALWIGFDINELHNGSDDNDRDPRYTRDAVISRAFTWTVAISPITLARNGLGTIASNRKRNSEPASGSTPEPTTPATENGSSSSTPSRAPAPASPSDTSAKEPAP
jgi:hypothetical protein